MPALRNARTKAPEPETVTPKPDSSHNSADRLPGGVIKGHICTCFYICVFIGLRGQDLNSLKGVILRRSKSSTRSLKPGILSKWPRI